jgi:hypothetical protein
MGCTKNNSPALTNIVAAYQASKATPHDGENDSPSYAFPQHQRRLRLSRASGRSARNIPEAEGSVFSIDFIVQSVTLAETLDPVQ